MLLLFCRATLPLPDDAPGARSKQGIDLCACVCPRSAVRWPVASADLFREKNTID
jgi:hypothetical protein